MHYFKIQTNVGSLYFCSLVVLISFSGCSAFKRIYQEKPQNTPCARANILAIFMDGTSNKPHAGTDRDKNSNIYKLKTLTRCEIPSYYIEGVGNGTKILGMGLGVGFSKRVRYTYSYLADHYNRGDTLCLFGFSRGAYSCRVLSNVIYVAGIPDLRHIQSRRAKRKIVRNIYNKYRGNYSLSKRKERVEKFIAHWNKGHSKQQVKLNTADSIKIAVMGLFETVEAMGAPDYCESDFQSANKNHLNQIANIEHVYHAMALDDNRANIFTPILFTTKEIKESSAQDINKVVDEVWFSGSHSDIGGGLTINPEIRNTSLHWMISKTRAFNLFNTDLTIMEDSFEPVKNMQEDPIWIFFYKNKNRSLPMYYDSTRLIYNNGKIKIHESVIKRLAEGIIPEFKTANKDLLDWFDKCPFSSCFIKDGKKRLLKADCNCIEVVKTID